MGLFRKAQTDAKQIFEFFKTQKCQK